MSRHVDLKVVQSKEDQQPTMREEKQKFTLYNTPMDGIPASLPSCNSKLIMLMDLPIKMVFFQK